MGMIINQNSIAAQIKINAFTKVDADYLITKADQFIAVDCSNGSITVTLPSAAIDMENITYPIFTQTYEIKKTDQTQNHLNVLTTDSQTIDGENSFILDESYEAISLISDGYNWLIC